MLQASKFIGTGLASIGFKAAGVRKGCCFGASIISVTRNPALWNQLFSSFPGPNPSCSLYKNLPVTPAVTYPDAEASKSQILKDNKGKAGVYRWTNKVNGKTYIGSTVDLTKRFYNYFSVKQLKEGSGKDMAISKALLKYTHSKFKVEIFEYCDRSDLIKREQYYLDRFKPEYNLNPRAGSRLGCCLSAATRQKIREAAKKRTAGTVAANTARCKAVCVWDIQTGKLLGEYASQVEAAKELGVNPIQVMRYIRSGKAFKSLYLITNKKS